MKLLTFDNATTLQNEGFHDTDWLAMTELIPLKPTCSQKMWGWPIRLKNLSTPYNISRRHPNWNPTSISVAMSDRARPTEPALAVAIDFGTSFSGISYKDLSRPYSEAPEHFTTWPGISKIRTFHKVPTVIAYPFDTSKRIVWGFEAEQLGPDSESYFRCEMFKPHLHALGEKVVAPGSKPLKLPRGKTVKDITRDYLNLLFEHFEVTMSDNYPRAFYDYHILFTVPATFSGHTVNLFREVVETTNFGGKDRMKITYDVGSLTEPEGATMYTIFKQPRFQFETGDCIVVCDAGGGTVDVCSYLISEAKTFPYTFKQAGIATAAYCGSTMIDHAFKEFVREEIGCDNVAKLKYSERYTLKREFVERKEEFSDDDAKQAQYIPLPSSVVSQRVGSGKTGCVEGDMLKITREQMRNFFGTTVQQTAELLLAHIKQARAWIKRQSSATSRISLKYIYLVGGLGTSPYFKSALQARVSEKYPTIRIISPHFAHLAVVDGAARVQYHRLNPSTPNPIQSRLLKNSYGVVVSRVFDPSIHTEDRKVRDPISGDYLVKDHISWFAVEGESYEGSGGKTVSKQLRRKFKKPGVFYDELVTGEVGSNGRLPKTKRDGKVRVICRVKSDFSQFDKKDFGKVKKDLPGTFGLLKKKSGYEATFSLVMTVEAAKVEFETLMNGLKAGGINLSVNWEERNNQHKEGFGSDGIPAQELEG
ncbi:hypothetical protein BJ508DRAFT_333874 [Ascobolus immersus RN42]|uniref:Actin-like ATPase domain-containing protein n=1 Tax=Ascobolus immersus RN42 TaxID=1160509 RepID=A0A3N4HPA6_ASCIM|nr:hypothetical protein BJ508DRAFT_333874 [Ascobolus immersus RN42]